MSRIQAPVRGVFLVAIGALLLLSGSVVGDAAAQTTQPDTDNTVTRLDVREDGSARWTVQIRTRLDTEETSDEYRAFKSRFRNDTSLYLGTFRSRMTRVVSDASNTTRREMRATNFTASATVQEVPRRWGVVTYRFTWGNFASTENDPVVVGDVFEGGFFLAQNDSLQMEPPEGYEAVTVEPEPDSRDGDRLVWRGRHDFSDGRPRVVFRPVQEEDSATDNQTSTSTGGDGDTTQTGEDTSDGSNRGLLFVGVALVLIVAGAAIYYYRREQDSSSEDNESDTKIQADTETQTQTSTAAETGSGTVMTDEERVEAVLEANGGRMRQAEIADEFDWSASKTSRVIGKMVEDDSVEKLRLGRENLIDLSGFDTDVDESDSDSELGSEE
ncbi:DUF4897 domain-containing protein [Halorutilales archaeon Cl-col2-1]